MSCMYFDENVFDLLCDGDADVDVDKLVYNAEVLSSKKKKQQQKQQKHAGNNRVPRHLETKKNFIVVCSNETGEKEEQKAAVHNGGNQTINHRKHMEQAERVELEPVKEGEGDESEEKESKKKLLKLRRKERKNLKKEQEEEAKNSAAGVVKRLFSVAQKAVTVVGLMTLGAVMYSAFDKL